MSGVINLGSADEKRLWFGPGWIFRGVLGVVFEKAKAEGDEEIAEVVTQGEALHGLHLHLIEQDSPGLSTRILEVLNTAANEIVEARHSVSVEGRVLPEKDQRLFRESVSDLLHMIAEAKAASKTKR